MILGLSNQFYLKVSYFYRWALTLPIYTTHITRALFLACRLVLPSSKQVSVCGVLIQRYVALSCELCHVGHVSYVTGSCELCHVGHVSCHVGHVSYVMWVM